ncbi:DUF2711 family protein [Sphingobacterium faecium]
MSDIFKDENIYPYQGKIKEHFKGFYDATFIAFIPFFQIDSQTNNKVSLKKSKLLSHEEAVQEFEFLKDLPKANRQIYSYKNDEYPSNETIFLKGKAISWNKVVTGSGFTDYAELNKALRTSIGALNNNYARPDLLEKLNAFTDKKSIYHPTEGTFDMLSKVSIYKTFQFFRKHQIVITDEFYQQTFSINLDKLSEFEFCNQINFKDYYLYSADFELLFTVEWDSFFFIIATDSKKMEQLIESKLFEGFLCNDETDHHWDYMDKK